MDAATAEFGTSERPSPGELFATFGRIGLLSFGGPAAQIALMHRVLVEEKKWLSEERYLNALSFCMLLPGPEAMQLATYAGWCLRGRLGGLLAGLLFVLPGALVVLVLAAVYAAFGQVPLIEAVFQGIKAAVLVIVVEALLRIARRSLGTSEHWVVAGATFVAIFFLALPYPLIVLAAALYGFVRLSRAGASRQTRALAVGLRGTLATVAGWAALWLLPLLGLTWFFGRGNVVADLGWLFSKLAVVTFGGAYAVLAYLSQDVVTVHGWLETGEMMDGLGLAETTPGPLILVTEFVGFLAAWRHGGEPAFLFGLLGALVALWATFVPCFLWIFAGAPYIEWINAQPRLRGALAGITAAVVGVILNLALWFALHVFFAEVEPARFGPFHLWVPTLGSFGWALALLALVSGYLLLVRHWSVPAVLLAGALLAVSLGALPG